MRKSVVLVLASLLGACGGQVQNTSDPSLAPSTAQGAYVLSEAKLSDQSAFGRAVTPLAQSLCVGTPIESWTATVSVDDSGQGLMVLSSPCLLIHVPLEVASIDTSSLTALVPTEELVSAWSGDISAGNQSSEPTCDDAKIIGTRMRAASDATLSLDGNPNIAAMTLSLEFTSRQTGDAPAAPPTDPCAGRD
jgi:hypothetical protein